MTLLEKARAVRTRGNEARRNASEMDLAVAWLERKVSTCQVRKALIKRGSTQALVWLAITARAAMKAGRIKAA